MMIQAHFKHFSPVWKGVWIVIVWII